MEKIYLLTALYGEYEDFSCYNLCAFSSREEAELFKLKLENLITKFKKKSDDLNAKYNVQPGMSDKEFVN